MYQFSLLAITRYFDELPYALAVTLWLSLETIVLSTAIGIAGALCRRSESLL